MTRWKRGLAIVLSTCMIGGMMPLPVSAEETVSGNTMQTESTESTEYSQEDASEQNESEAIVSVQALIDALPDADSITEDMIEDVTAQLDAIDEAKATLTDEQLAGLDFARYDATANVLLALWGEAPTDEVETLDYTAPEKDSEGYYKIASENDLYWLATTEERKSKEFKTKLTENIIVNRNVLNDNGSLNTGNFKAWTPITDFYGTLDGNGHTISGLYCITSSTDPVGLFGTIGGTVKHLGVVDSYFEGRNFVGGVCGRNSGSISGCYSTATVKCPKLTSGILVGASYGRVENSFAYGHALEKADAFGLYQGSGHKKCFYLSTTSEDKFSTDIAGATAAQFKSGEVAYLLGLEDSIWKQDLKTDIYPSFDGQSVGKSGNDYHNHNSADTCDICKKELTVTAGSLSITYGDPVPTYTATFDGLVSADDTDTFKNQLVITCAYVQAGSEMASGAAMDNSNAKTYVITPSGLPDTNYRITYHNGTLTVNPKTIGIIWGDTLTFDYDGNKHLPTATQPAWWGMILWN